MQSLPQAFAGFVPYRQFIICEFSPKPKGGTDKRPIDPRTMLAGSIHDKDIWMDGPAACALATTLGPQYGVGFVFTVDDPFFFLDLDHCVDTETGELSDIANELISAAPGAAVEWSHSGDGVHIFGRGTFGGHKKKNREFGIEFYTEMRFAALTGEGAQGNCDIDCTAILTPTIEKYFPPETAIAGDDGEVYTTEPRPEWDGPTDDDVLIAKALQSGSAAQKLSNTKASFADLFNANETVLAACYPEVGDKGRAYGASEADAALAQHLAFWTGCDEARMDRIMRRSQLVRDKWEDRGDYYLPRTIKGATARQESVYSKQPNSPAPAPAAQPVNASPVAGTPAAATPAAPGTTAVVEDTPGVRFLSIEAQKEYFRDFVYVAELDSVFTPDTGKMWKQANFKNYFSNYTFALDTDNAKTTTNAWQAFCSSQGAKFKKVHDVEFRPDYPEGNIRENRGSLILNKYLDRRGRTLDGDPTPFLLLLEKMLPVEEDRVILLSYMAAAVQHMGVKFRYAPVVQGTEGNGKSTLGNIVEYAIGEEYTFKPSASSLVSDGGKFNGWMGETIWIVLEDVHIPNNAGGAIDAMKPLITNSRIEIQAKGRDQQTGDNRGNWFILCNRKGDVPVTDSSRRYCSFFTAQQSAEDKLRDGMTDEYWGEFWDWMEGRGEGMEPKHGYAICHHLLATYEIPAKYNPALISSAPRTSATAEAVVASRTQAQETVAEAINAGYVGFRDGWASSYHIDTLLDNKRQSIRPNQRREMMKGLGYIWHPRLREGRCPTSVDAEGHGKPVLYVREDHIAVLNEMQPAEVKAAYMKAQYEVPGGVYAVAS
tara:strand:- start:373 stop:2847 length:2475 start_codon:yes stop_codon:yes gene_type:complete